MRITAIVLNILFFLFNLIGAIDAIILRDAIPSFCIMLAVIAISIVSLWFSENTKACIVGLVVNAYFLFSFTMGMASYNPFICLAFAIIPTVSIVVLWHSLVVQVETTRRNHPDNGFNSLIDYNAPVWFNLVGNAKKYSLGLASIVLIAVVLLYRLGDLLEFIS